MCIQFSQTHRLFVFPTPTWQPPTCHFAELSLQARRSHREWQHRFLIYKSQKDRFNIHEQSVPPQQPISVTGGTVWWQHSDMKEKFCFHAFRNKMLHPPNSASVFPVLKYWIDPYFGEYWFPCLKNDRQTMLSCSLFVLWYNSNSRREENTSTLFYRSSSCLCFHHGKVQL